MVAHDGPFSVPRFGDIALPLVVATSCAGATKPYADQFYARYVSILVSDDIALAQGGIIGGGACLAR